MATITRTPETMSRTPDWLGDNALQPGDVGRDVNRSTFVR